MDIAPNGTRSKCGENQCRPAGAGSEGNGVAVLTSCPYAKGDSTSAVRAGEGFCALRLPRVSDAESNQPRDSVSTRVAATMNGPTRPMPAYGAAPSACER